MNTLSRLRRYYDSNTRLFLGFGTGWRNASIHRPIWGEGVKILQQAVHYSHRIFADELVNYYRNHQVDGVKVLDLGCGIGGSLFFLLENIPQIEKAWGISISPKQVENARHINRLRGFEDRLWFMEADFHSLPPLDRVNLAFAIESFILSYDQHAFFEQSSRVIVENGLLILVDDFLAEKTATQPLKENQTAWIEEFKHGWLAHGLGRPTQAVALAEQYGFKLKKQVDFSRQIRVNRLRDYWIAFLVSVTRPLRLRNSYLDNLSGGDALRKCIKNGITTYQMLVFEKK